MLAFLSRGPEVPRLSPARPPAPIGEPSPLLVHLAGEHATRVAGLWSPPHGPFVTAPAIRRHLLCLSFVLDVRLAPARAEVVLQGLLGPALREASPEAPPGLKRALGRLGEQAWPADDYRRLLVLLGDPASAKVLRHAEAITADDVRALAALPESLAAHGGALIGLGRDRAALLAECYEVIKRREGPVVAGDAVRRWAGVRDQKALWDKVAYDLSPNGMTAPFPGTEALRALDTKAKLKDAGLRFRNCLQGRDLDEGYAHYEWLGPPPVVLSLYRDPVFGWRLEEAKCADNRSPPETVRGPLLQALRDLGVYVGRQSWELYTAISQAREPGFRLRPVEESVAGLFD